VWPAGVRVWAWHPPPSASLNCLAPCIALRRHYGTRSRWQQGEGVSSCCRAPGVVACEAGWTRVRAGGSWANPTGGGRASALGAEDPQHSTIDAPPTSSLHELRQHPWDPCGRSVRLEFSWAPRSLRSANGLAGGAGLAPASGPGQVVGTARVARLGHGSVGNWK